MDAVLASDLVDADCRPTFVVRVATHAVPAEALYYNPALHRWPGLKEIVESKDGAGTRFRHWACTIGQGQAATYTYGNAR